MLENLASNIVTAVVFAALGLGVFAAAFVVIDKLTPSTLWKEVIEEHNMSLAVLIGAMAIGVSIIIAAAIH